MCPFEIDLKGMCSISLQEFRNFKISIGLESRGFLVQKKSRKAKNKTKKMKKKKDKKRRRREKTERKIVTLCVYPYGRLKLVSGKDWK